MRQLILSLVLCTLNVVAMAAPVNCLFLQTAPHADLIHEQGDKYTLVLHKGPHQVGYFTEKPEHKSGLLEMTQFKQLWTNKRLTQNFSQIPPNVAIAMIKNDGEKQNFIAVLSKPEVKGEDIVYQLRKTSSNKIAPGNASDVVLYIDDISWNPGGF